MLRQEPQDTLSTDAAADLAVLGALLLGQGRHAEAEHALTQSLDVWQKRYGPHHYEVAVVQHNLAALHAARGDHQQAPQRAYQQVLDIKRHILGPDHPEVLGLQRHIDQSPEAL